MTAITTGLFVLAAGASLALAVLLTYSRGLSWFGRLPGYIRHRGARAAARWAAGCRLGTQLYRRF